MNKIKAGNQVAIVSNFQDMIGHRFHNDNNAVCWQRNLVADFQEIVDKLTLSSNITEISIDDLNSLQLLPAGEEARGIIMNDLLLLTDYGASPSLNLIRCYDRDDSLDYISTDVYSYHVDRSPVATDTFLCTYYGAASDIVPNQECIRKMDIPEIREKLMQLYDDSSKDFEEFLADNYFDLHYQALPGAQPTNLGNGNLWRLAVDHPGQEVLPCIHRAPEEKEGQLRLLLIC